MTAGEHTSQCLAVGILRTNLSMLYRSLSVCTEYSRQYLKRALNPFQSLHSEESLVKKEAVARHGDTKFLIPALRRQKQVDLYV